MIMLSIIIPCYNESGSIPKLLDICRESCKGKDFVEYIFVNNGSTDNSRAIFEQLFALAENRFAKLVDVPVNKGYGYGILQGLYAAGGDVLAWTHADLQTNPKDVIDAFLKYDDALTDNRCIVKGNRVGRNVFDDFFTGGMSLISSILLAAKLNDVNAQPKIFNRKYMELWERAPYDFSLDLYLLYVARRNKIPIETFPVRFEKRLYGEAKGGGTFKGKIKLIKRTFKYIVQLRKDLRNNKC
jgi:glycosyltransferase involved in cell wall biosynthesis